jgi:CDP-2,3-bis-(O-geranylgeranyl)-sn-glycerol synthase
MVFDIYTLVEAMWLIIPAYAANGLVPVFVKLLKGKQHPIDANKNFIDGKPLFGTGKSWEGVFFGALTGGIIGLIEQLAYPYLPWGISPIQLNIIPMSFYLGALLGLGAMVGDLVGAFLKRRFGLPRGRSVPILDQDDFIIFSFLFASFAVQLEVSWFVLLLVITPVMHWIACVVGYFVRVKKEPW